MEDQVRAGSDSNSSFDASLETQYQLEEFLESLWTLIEQGRPTVHDIYDEMGGIDVSHMLPTLQENGWIRIEGETISFEPEGERKAREVIRRHRLAERLLHDVLDMGWERLEENACRFEHVLSPDVTESICTFLGHPRTCPHGKSIPPGDCCRRFAQEVTPLVRPLSDLGIGREGTITFISSRYKSRLNQLTSLGIIPGTVLRLSQKRPTYVIQIGESSIALDKEITKNIFVRTRLREEA